MTAVVGGLTRFSNRGRGAGLGKVTKHNIKNATFGTLFISDHSGREKQFAVNGPALDLLHTIFWKSVYPLRLVNQSWVSTHVLALEEVLGVDLDAE